MVILHSWKVYYFSVFNIQPNVITPDQMTYVNKVTTHRSTLPFCRCSSVRQKLNGEENRWFKMSRTNEVYGDGWMRNAEKKQKHRFVFAVLSDISYRQNNRGNNRLFQNRFHLQSSSQFTCSAVVNTYLHLLKIFDYLKFSFYDLVVYHTWYTT